MASIWDREQLLEEDNNKLNHLVVLLCSFRGLEAVGQMVHQRCDYFWHQKVLFVV